ncbi:MAG: phosphatase PAP2 family protein, partial [Byssovorax sp.]
MNVPLDIGITAGAMVLGGMPRLFADETIRPWCGLACKPSDVNALDRTVIGHHSYAALQTSNAGFFASMGLPFLLGAVDLFTSHPSDGALGMAKDDLVLAETLSIVLVTNNVFSFIIRRPRPRTYDTSLSDEERLLPNNSFSFPSGHKAASFAMATAYSRIYMLRHPRSPWIAPLWIGTYSLAAMTGALRTYAGDHFWTDVITGAITGVGLGLLVPWMHTVELPTTTAAAATTALHVRFAPL